MNSRLKRFSEYELESDTRAVAPAGMILMDPILNPVAIDSGALSIFAVLGQNEGRGGSEQLELSIPAVIVSQLRRENLSAVPINQVRSIHFMAGVSSYTGRVYTLEPQGDFRQCLLGLYMTRDLSATESLQSAGVQYRLTDRERETLVGIVMGFTNKELAQRMHISTSTVKAFVRMVMAKMGVAKRAAAVAKVLEHMVGDRASGPFRVLLCLMLLPFFLSLSAQVAPSPSCVAPLCVSSAADSLAAPLPGTLRFAIENAPDGATINFDPALEGKTIALDRHELHIQRNLTLIGPGAGRLTISGGDTARILFIEDGAVKIAGVTLSHGLAKGGDGGLGEGGGGGGGGAAGMGGAIFLNRGSLTLNGVVFERNSAVGGNGGPGGAAMGGGTGGAGGSAAVGGTSNSPSGQEAGAGGSGGLPSAARIGGSPGGFGAGGGGGGACAEGGGSGGGNGFGGGAGGAGALFDPESGGSFPAAGRPGAGLGGAIFARAGFIRLENTAFSGNSATGGIAHESPEGAAKGGAIFLCSAALCGSDAKAMWSGNTVFRNNLAGGDAGEGCLGRHDEQVCGHLASSEVKDLQVSTPSTAQAGTPFTITVTALDVDGIPIPTYDSPIRLTTSDRDSAVSPASDPANGASSFRVVLRTCGTQTITAKDMNLDSVSAGTAEVEVTSPPA